MALNYFHTAYDSSILFTAILGVYAVYTLSLLLSALNNLYFHPLAKFPGPPLRAAFKLPQLWSLFKGTATHESKRLHDKYGDVVRIGPNALSFNTAQAWKDIYGTRLGRPQLSKDEDWFVDHKQPVNIIKSNDADHARIRKLISYAFSESALREQESLLSSHTDRLISRLKEQTNSATDGKVDMVKWYNFLTFDVIGDLCLGEPFRALETGEYHFWMIDIFHALKFWRVMRFGNTYPLFGIILRVFMWLAPSVEGKRDAFFKLPTTKVEKRLKSKTDRKDFMSSILRYNDERGMSKSEITDTASILIVGGSETTATLLDGATYLLLKNPQTLRRAEVEIRTTFTNEKEITFSSTYKLPYLQAVVEESLRIFPPASSIFPRRTGTVPEIIDGHVVPPNISVGVHQFATYHSAKNFHNPDAFVPERWLNPPPNEYKDDVKAALQPFHLGPRNCIGKNLAYFEIRSTLVRMLWNFDMELCPESDDWDNQRVFLVWEKHPLMIKLKPRVMKQDE